MVEKQENGSIRQIAPVPHTQTKHKHRQYSDNISGEITEIGTTLKI